MHGIGLKVLDREDSIGFVLFGYGDMPQLRASDGYVHLEQGYALFSSIRQQVMLQFYHWIWLICLCCAWLPVNGDYKPMIKLCIFLGISLSL